MLVVRVECLDKMSQFLTINKLVGHMLVKQGVFVVKVTMNISITTGQFQINYIFSLPRSQYQILLQTQVWSFTICGTYFDALLTDRDLCKCILCLLILQEDTVEF